MYANIMVIKTFEVSELAEMKKQVDAHHFYIGELTPSIAFFDAGIFQ